MRFLFLFFFYVAINIKPIFAEEQTIQINTGVTFLSEKSLDLKNRISTSDSYIADLGIRYASNKSSSQLSLNYSGNGKYTLDGSYIQYSHGIATFGLGAIDRHWSFSNKTSLILSHNARPTKSIYLELEDRFGYDWLPSEANWSFEIFNGITEGNLNNANAMIIGSRAILSPIEGLSFELVQTSQWGGKGYSTGISALGAALLMDTNDSTNSNINKMAGFGISYSMPNHMIPLKIYGQAIGEDEAGAFPSCLAYLAGVEWSNTKIKYPTTIGFETIDTRIDTTTHGNCGPNTMYNNNTYSYTNYGEVMGASIDTEGTTLGLFVQSQLSQDINIEYATKAVVINDNNWSNHRLSSKRQSGLINSLGASWDKNNISFRGDIYHQDFILDNASIERGFGIGLYSSIMF